MSTTTLDLKIKADAKAAVQGLKPLSKSLNGLTKDAEKTESALKDLDKKHTVKINDAAVENAKKEIERLRAKMREDLTLDVNADTKVAQKRIRELQSIVRTLDAKDVKVEVKVDVDKSALTRLRTGLGRVRAGGAAAIGGITEGLSTLARVTGPVVGSVVGVFAGLSLAAGLAAKSTLGLADSLENAKIAFTQFLGSTKQADRFLRDLQKFAAKTPFEFPELVESSKKLLAFGIRSKDVIGIMTTLGDAAALTGNSVDDLAEIWGQMAAKGKVSNEELLQMTERGIPVYALLAQAMGKSVAEIQKMAEKGQLLSDNVLPVLQGRMDKTFGGGMAKQAETLSGKISTLMDTLKGFGTSIGQALLPFAKNLTDKIQPALDNLSTWASDNRGKVAEAIGTGVGKVLDFLAAAADGLAGLLDGVLTTVGNVVVGIGEAAQGLSSLPGVEDSLGDDTVAQGQKLIAMGEAGNAASDGLRSAADGLRDAAAGARDFSREISGGFDLDVKKQDLDDTLATLEELKHQPPTVEVEANITKARQAISKLRKEIQAEEDKKRRVTLQVQVKHKRSELHSIDAALENLGKKKVTPQVKADISQWTAKRKTVAAEMESLKRKLAKIPVGANTKPAVDAMRNIPVPSVNIPVAATGVSGVNADIDHAARDRDTTIYVKARKVKGSGGTSPDFDVNGLAGGTSIVPQLFGADPATVAGLRAVSRQASTVAVGGTAQLSATTSGQRTVTHLAPKQAPVKIYLDGAEIADHLQLKAGRLATATTVRRRA